MQNIGGKKRVRWEHLDSEYLFANFLAAPAFRSTDKANLNRRIKTHLREANFGTVLETFTNRL